MGEEGGEGVEEGDVKGEGEGEEEEGGFEEEEEGGEDGGGGFVGFGCGGARR